MEIKDSTTKDKLIKRLRRVEGQVQGLQTMLQEERDCREILQQLSAVSAAVKSTSRAFFQDYATLCLAELSKQGKLDQPEDSQMLLREMIDLLDKTP